MGITTDFVYIHGKLEDTYRSLKYLSDTSTNKTK